MKSELMTTNTRCRKPFALVFRHDRRMCTIIAGKQEKRALLLSGSPDHYPRFADYEWRNGFGSRELGIHSGGGGADRSEAKRGERECVFRSVLQHEDEARRLSSFTFHPPCSSDERMTPRNWVAIEYYVSNVVKKQFRSALLACHQGSTNGL